MRRHPSMRTQVVALVVATGLLGLLLAQLGGEYYRHLLRDSIAHTATLRAQELLGDEQARARDLALRLQHGDAFRQAYARSDRAALEGMLASSLEPGHADALKVIGMHVLDAGLRTVASIDHDVGNDALCPVFMALASARPPAERIKPMAALCAVPTHVHHVTLVAIGGLRPVGYLAVVTDPTPALQRMERGIGMPLRLRVGATVLYSSGDWPGKEADDPLVAATALNAFGTAPPVIELAAGTGELGEKLRGARWLLWAIGSLTTAGVVLVGLWLFNRCTLRPLGQLADRMRLVRSDRSLLGTQITPCGNAEMRELAEDFNEFSAELKELHSTMESLAYHDNLTGLPNRLLFRDRLEQQILLTQREGGTFAVCVIDLDHFKVINDTRGHHVGDLLLQQVGKRMRRVLRRSDTLALTGNTLARLGGDEFCALLPTVRSAEDAAAVAAKLIGAVEEPFDLEGEQLRVAMSIGFALYPAHGASAEQLARCADDAMYQAKRDRCGFAVYGVHAIESAAAS